MQRKTLLFVAPMLIAAASMHAQGVGRRGGAGGRGGPPGALCFGTADSLSDAQKAKVQALADAFAKAHQPQLDSLRAIMEAARAAREAGKSQEEVRAIMELAKPIHDELAPFDKTYRETVVTYLTPAQIAQGCIPPAPGGPGRGGRRGGPPADQ